LQGHHRSHDGARPHHRLPHHETDRCDHDHRLRARLFLCAEPGCRAQVLICSDCDRGHIYCADCAPHARRRSLHKAGERYQASSRGRNKHAERARRYRARQNKVTHPGSPLHRTDAVLAVDPAVSSGEPVLMHSRQPPYRQRWCCFRCGRRCSEHVRQGFLQRRVQRNRRRGPDHDYPT
jgi:hypothetical protein